MNQTQLNTTSEDEHHILAFYVSGALVTFCGTMVSMVILAAMLKMPASFLQKNMNVLSLSFLLCDLIVSVTFLCIYLKIITNTDAVSEKIFLAIFIGKVNRYCNLSKTV